MGFIITDLHDVCNTFAAVRRSGAAESQRDGRGVSHLGADKDEHGDGGQAGKSGEGGIYKMAEEGGGVAKVRRKLRVAVIGDFMEDRYWIGEAERLSAEVPIPVVKIKEYFWRSGGAGNVAKNLEALGVEVNWANYGGMLPTKHRLMVGDHQLARWDEYDSCRPWIGALPFDGCDAVVVADYAKGAITAEIVEKIKRFEGPIFVDTKCDPSVWSGVATAVFPNLNEYTKYWQSYVTFNGVVILKRGEKGLKLCGLKVDAKGIESPAQARFVRSVNGAGDSVIAAFVYKYLTDKPNICLNSIYDANVNFWQSCLDFANTAAACACEAPYTYAPTIEEVEERYYRGNES